MVSIIMAASEEMERLAIAAGFMKQQVLIRHNYVTSTPANKTKLERELMDLGSISL